MSTSVIYGMGFPTEGRGKPPKCPLLPGYGCWFVGEYPPDCHESGALSFFVLWVYARCRECWNFSRIHGFLIFTKKGKKTQ